MTNESALYWNINKKKKWKKSKVSNKIFESHKNKVYKVNFLEEGCLSKKKSLLFVYFFFCGRCVKSTN